MPIDVALYTDALFCSKLVILKLRCDLHLVTSCILDVHFPSNATYYLSK